MEKYMDFLAGFVVGLVVISFPVILSSRRKHHNKNKSGFFKSLSLYEGNSIINSITGKLKIMALTLTDTQQASGVLSFVDKKGSPTDVPDGNVQVASSDDTVATVSYDDPTNTVTVVAQKAGVATLKIVATNKAGTQLPFDDVAVEVTSGDAASGTISFGAPTEQP